VTLHSCFQPASLTPHPAPLHNLALAIRVGSMRVTHHPGDSVEELSGCTETVYRSFREALVQCRGAVWSRRHWGSPRGPDHQASPTLMADLQLQQADAASPACSATVSTTGCTLHPSVTTFVATPGSMMTSPSIKHGLRLCAGCARMLMWRCEQSRSWWLNPSTARKWKNYGSKQRLWRRRQQSCRLSCNTSQPGHYGLK